MQQNAFLGQDLEKCWLRLDTSQEKQDPNAKDAELEIMDSPSHVDIGTSIDAQHRVIQVCVGSEHGVLRTDAGIAFTWGDNRYGQLGRSPVQKEENGIPWPVIDLLEEEVVMVASGKAHCLALTSDGGVKAWGRNKQGQLGIGNYRDKVEPQWVRLAPKLDTDDPDKGPRLGERRSANDKNMIVQISAGGNSSIAAARNSDVWQWGELNTDYKDDGKDKKGHSRSKEKEGLQPVAKCRPHCVASWKRQSFRTQMRQQEKEPVRVSATLGMVIQSEVTRGQREAYQNIVSLVDENKSLCQQISDWRGEAKRHEQSKEGSGKLDKDDEDAGEGAGVGDLQDTIAFLERDIELINREIDMYEKNIKSCEQTQNHNRKQIEMLTHQATQLTESQGKFSQDMLDSGKSGQQKKQLELQLNEIRDFIEANQNTRATLLDQRAETDKEKQRLMSQKEDKEKSKYALVKRLQMVHELGKDHQSKSAAGGGGGASDFWVKKLGEYKDDLTEWFDKKPLGNADILEAKKKLEKDEKFLKKQEAHMNELLQNNHERGHLGTRPEICKALLEDLVDLRRRLNDMVNDKYYKEDLNFDQFFKNAKRPEGDTE